MLIVYLTASVIIYILYALLARCPRCGMPFLLRPRKVLGMDLYTWAILTPERCRHCGADL